MSNPCLVCLKSLGTAVPAASTPRPLLAAGGGPAVMAARKAKTTILVSNIPRTVTAPELLHFFNTIAGPDSVFACSLATERPNCLSKGVGRVQFDSLSAALEALRRSADGTLVYGAANLSAVPSADDIVIRPVDPAHRLDGCALHMGIMQKPDTLAIIESWAGIKAELMPERKKINFLVDAREDGGGGFYKLEMPFSDLSAIFECPRGDRKSDALLLQFKYAPRVFERLSGPLICPPFVNDRYHVCKEDQAFLWVRATDFSKLKSIGRATHMCWELMEGKIISEIFCTFPYKKKLDSVFKIRMEPCFSIPELVPLIYWPTHPSVSYEVFFQLNSLVQTQKVTLSSVNSDLLLYLSSLSEGIASRILMKMHNLESTCYDPVEYLRNQWEIEVSRKRPKYISKESLSNDKNLMSCHRLLVTPSKIYFRGPETETSNFVVNHFSEYASDFLRVTFVDEDWGKLHPSALSVKVDTGVLSKSYRTQLYKRILSILQNGLLIGPKKFEFLAFSASQLRSNAVWMFASNKSLTAQDIRNWMGEFSKIRSISKCAARMGQLFSSCTPTLMVPPPEVDNIADIESSYDGIKYCFSDGIGKISLSLARTISAKCGLKQTPSAFQIRYGGHKGVLVVDRRSFKKISLRPSMKKFESKNTMLCVTRWSDSMPCYLNREIICLLSTLGVEDEAFKSLQLAHMVCLDKMLTDKEVALDFMASICGGEMERFLSEMLLHGYDPSVEPYLYLMLKAYQELQLTDLRSRCRIFMPKGRILMGCLDEVGLLNYGQVYIRVTMTMNEKNKFEDSQSFFHQVDETTAVVVGKVVITKNPCLHPGDVRVLEAVYVKALEETNWMDCIIFPQKGARPHPNECSGGDLDGDLFFVCWDKNLIPQESDTPMDYLGGRPRIMDHNVTMEEIHTFFLNYMINDTLGATSTAHLIHADSEPLKARSPKCLQLAALHSMAVDFAKTGTPAEMPRVLTPKVYPDFLEREDRPMFTSPGIVGKLYRAAVGYPTATQNDEYMWSEESYDSDLQVDGFEEFLVLAKSYKAEYKERLSSLMIYYDADTEDEILTGNLRRKANYLKKDRKLFGEVKDRMLNAVKNLRKEVKEWVTKEVSESVQLQKMASACYHVTYHPSFHQKTDFLSFPWILSDVLFKIKELKKGNFPSDQDERSHILVKVEWG